MLHVEAFFVHVEGSVWVPNAEVRIHSNLNVAFLLKSQPSGRCLGKPVTQYLGGTTTSVPLRPDQRKA